MAACVIAAGSWAFATTFQGAFVFDDFLSIAQNPHVRTLWPLSAAASAPSDTTLAGRPVASLSFALNYAAAPPDAREVFEPPRGATSGGGADASPAATSAFHRNVRGYHAANLAIHLAAALALLGIARRTLRSDQLRERYAGIADWLALAIALLWVVHPLHTEAVTYVVQRVESLMGLFALLTLYCAIRAAEARGAGWWVPASVIAYALALGTKESAAVIPAVVIAWDRVFLRAGTPPRDAWRARWPLYAGLAAATLLLFFTVPGARTKSVGFGLDGWTPWTWLLTQSGVIVHYVRLAFWPSPLVLDPHWPPVRSFTQAAWSVTALSVLVTLAAAGIVRRRPAAFAGACFFLLLAPTSSVLPIVTEVGAEHRMYLPLVALISLVVVGAYLAWQRLAGRAASNPWLSRAAPVGAVLVLLVAAAALGLATRARSLDYASAERIWRDTVTKQPRNARARTALAAELVASARYGEAEAELRTALALDPDRPETLSNLGAAEFALGRIDASIGHLERAIALRPDFAAAHRNLAAAYRARGRDADTAAQLRRVLEAEPNHPAALKDLALLLSVTPDDGLRDGAEALSLARRAVTVTDGQDAASLAALAAAYAELDRFDEAVSAMREAAARASGNAALAQQLSSLLQEYAAHRKVRQGR